MSPRRLPLTLRQSLWLCSFQQQLLLMPCYIYIYIYLKEKNDDEGQGVTWQQKWALTGRTTSCHGNQCDGSAVRREEKELGREGTSTLRRGLIVQLHLPDSRGGKKRKKIGMLKRRKGIKTVMKCIQFCQSLQFESGFGTVGLVCPTATSQVLSWHLHLFASWMQWPSASRVRVYSVHTGPSTVFTGGKWGCR